MKWVLGLRYESRALTHSGHVATGEQQCARMSNREQSRAESRTSLWARDRAGGSPAHGGGQATESESRSERNATAQLDNARWMEFYAQLPIWVFVDQRIQHALSTLGYVVARVRAEDGFPISAREIANHTRPSRGGRSDSSVRAHLSVLQECGYLERRDVPGKSSVWRTGPSMRKRPPWNQLVPHAVRRTPRVGARADTRIQTPGKWGSVRTEPTRKRAETPAHGCVPSEEKESRTEENLRQQARSRVESEEPSASTTFGQGAHVERVIAHWETVNGRTLRRSSKQVRRLKREIRERFSEGHSVGDLCRAIDALKDSKYHLNNGYRGLQYAVRSDDQVRMMLARADQGSTRSGDFDIDPNSLTFEVRR